MVDNLRLRANRTRITAAGRNVAGIHADVPNMKDSVSSMNHRLYDNLWSIRPVTDVTCFGVNGTALAFAVSDAEYREREFFSCFLS